MKNFVSMHHAGSPAANERIDYDLGRVWMLHDRVDL